MCIQHFVQGDQVVIARQSHVGAGKCIGRTSHIAAQARSLDTVGNRIADQSQNILQGLAGCPQSLGGGSTGQLDQRGCRHGCACAGLGLTAADLRRETRSSAGEDSDQAGRHHRSQDLIL